MSSACQVDPFCIDCPGAEVDAGSEDGGMMDAPLVRIDAQGDAFSPDAYMLPDGCTPGAPELCNGHDDDCDRMVDEGIDLMTDVRNCGGCGMRCAPPNAFGICMNGNCRMGDCAAGYIDL
ncbi:MAG: hypothetical protein RMJ84_12795, partial [Sandaracinaceae bacterium]|nr:hypothetical protein [Sandaracinaceae bacterium]